MKVKKILSFILILTLILPTVPAAIFTASAQECVWNLRVNGIAYSKQEIGAGAVPGLSFSGSTLTLTNFTGQSIAAIAGGFYGEDDAPVLNINLVGTNVLSGGYFKVTNYGVEALTEKNTETGAFFGALVSEPRSGGSGDISKIVIGGTGSLEINAEKSHRINKRKFGDNYKITEIRSDVNIIAVMCEQLTVRDGADVTVNFGGRGVTAAKVTGVEGNVVNTNSGRLNINANVGTFSDVTKKVQSSCAVTGVDGSVEQSGNKGYFGCQLYSVLTTSDDIAAIRGNLTVSNAYGASYVSAPAGKKTVSGTVTADPGLRKLSFSDEAYEYLAYGPKTYSDMLSNTSLTEIYPINVAGVMTFPETGEDKVFDSSYSAWPEKGFFLKETSYMTEPSSGQSWGNDYWSKYTFCETDGNNEPAFVYEFDASIMPMPGYWFVPGYGNMTDNNIENAFDFEPYKAEWATFGLFVMYFYATPYISQQPQTVWAGDTEIGLKASVPHGELKYEWYMDVYNGENVISSFAVGDNYGDMDGFADTNSDTMRLGGLTKTDEVPGTEGNFTYGDASKVLIWCKVSGIGRTTESNRVEYKLFEDSVITVKKQPVSTELDNTGKAKFTFECEGEGLTYDWYMNGNLISSASNKSGNYGFSGYNTNTLTVTVESEMGASYIYGRTFECVARDDHGSSATSDKVKVINPANLPKITAQPVSCDYIRGGDNPTFTVKASGTGLSYQWYWGSTALTNGAVGGWSAIGANTDTLTIDAKKMSFGNAAKWDVYCIVSNADGNATTEKVKINEIETPAFKTQPVNCTADEKGGGSFTAELEKTDGVTYQWYLEDGTQLSDTTTAAAWNLSGTKTKTLSVTAKTPYTYTMAKFYCVATYKGVRVTSDTASLVKPHACADSIVKVGAKAPTCTKTGLKEHYKCDKCGKLYSDNAAAKPITAADVTVAAAGHKWDAGTVTREATESSKGVKKYTCTVCKATKTESFDYVKPVETVKLGDADNDKAITVSDARIALRVAILLENYPETSREFKACDVDGSKGVSVNDARAILRVAILLDPESSFKAPA